VRVREGKRDRERERVASWGGTDATVKSERL